eukprot:GEMP01054988.1.p2 GENE.GEMP01054988.1~~GEMP01054988.1.p2  ORF type:complete len:104 (-),score=3.82 GEMP01054988.1:191-502(-)
MPHRFLVIFVGIRKEKICPCGGGPLRLLGCASRKYPKNNSTFTTESKIRGRRPHPSEDFPTKRYLYPPTKKQQKVILCSGPTDLCDNISRGKLPLFLLFLSPR